MSNICSDCIVASISTGRSLRFSRPGSTFRRTEANVVEVPIARLSEIFAIPIRFTVTERFGSDAPITPYEKDYDALERVGTGLDVANWGLIVAEEDGRWVGALTIAFQCPEFRLLEGRSDLAHVVDLRVRLESRGRGVGRAMWLAAERWGLDHGVVEIRVETQDVNAAACRFYAAMGCHELLRDENAYPPELAETQIIWAKATPSRPTS